MDWKALESRPGSFSKNFGWGDAPGLGLLHRVINAVFSDGLMPVPRDAARKIIAQHADGDPLVPLNFFLYNQVVEGESYIIPDQLVLEALAGEHDQSFDRLAMCALNFSRVGTWDRARPFQSHPAPWARRFVVEEVWNGHQWDVSKITSDKIEEFFSSGAMIYSAASPRKFATNLHYLYQQSSLLGLTGSEREDWWSSALFLFLDRCIFEREISLEMSAQEILTFVEAEDFWALTAADPALAYYAAFSVIEEYLDLGGPARLDDMEWNGGTVEAASNTSPRRTGSPRLSSHRDITKRKKPTDLTLTVVQRAYAQAQQQVRNRLHAEWVKNLYDNRCAICGIALKVDPTGKTYSEAGHVKPVGDPFKGPDHLKNILPFCPNHHKAFDQGGVWIHPNEGNPIVRSATGDTEINGRKLEILAEHGFGVEYAEWHAKYFRHIQ
ncbi:HNH endonuclease [Vannielia litorea]|uniref:HNH endonuclease n=1 Tax=Vannielia litorea TaxID=1217970 RepID=A0A1N6H2K1_9RHOB|nr:HNH endonuclease [Vannielia litorea]SIO13989.1 HNH endonuclease [Vannielia litorea]